MPFYETYHLGRRALGRGVNISDVYRVLGNPSSTWTDTRNRSRVFRGTAADGRSLIVCLVDPTPADGVDVIKTTYWAEGEN